MKDLKAFLEDVKTNKELSAKVSEAKDAKEMVAIANAAGYTVTEDEMTDFLMESVSGGFSLAPFTQFVRRTLDVMDKVDSADATNLGQKARNLASKGLHKIGDQISE